MRTQGRDEWQQPPPTLAFSMEAYGSLDITALNCGPAVRQLVTSCNYRAIWPKPEKNPSNMYRYVQGLYKHMSAIHEQTNWLYPVKYTLQFHRPWVYKHIHTHKRQLPHHK
jgi:hypothetical protein